MNKELKMPGIRANVAPYGKLQVSKETRPKWMPKKNPKKESRFWAYHIQSWGMGAKAARRTLPYVRPSGRPGLITWPALQRSGSKAAPGYCRSVARKYTATNPATP